MHRHPTRDHAWCGALMLMLAVFASAWCAPLQARVVEARIERVDAGLVQANDVVVWLDWADDAVTGHLRLQARQVRADAIGYAWRDLRWSCELERLEDGRTQCSGPAVAGEGPVFSDAGGARIGVSSGAAGTTGGIFLGDSALTVQSEADAPDQLTLLATRVPVAWLEAFVATLWTGGRFSAGVIDGELDFHTGLPDGLQVRGDIAMQGVGFDTPDGLLAGEGVGARLDLDIANRPGRIDIALEGEVLGGELLAGRIYVPLPEAPVGVALDARRDSDSASWDLQRLHWADGDALVVDGQLALGPDLAPAHGTVRFTSADAGTLGERYLAGLLAPAGLSQLRLFGTLGGELGFDDGALSHAGLELDGVNAIDGAGRFSFAGLRGHPRWTAGAQRVESRLSWSAGALYGLGLGAVELPLESQRGEIGLVDGVAMDLLGGRLAFDHFVVRAAGDSQQARIGLGLELTGLDLADLSQRLGWPAFTGTVEGRIPSAVYADNQLTLDGGLTMQLFGGRLDIGALAMERPFGVAPTLSADVTLQGIELLPLTAAFGFGEITGELAGRISGLRLVDWSPVAFDANLHSDPDYRGRQRISQRAVRDISSVGGNFFVSGLQNQALRLFSSFGYSRIGISCRLADEVCLMDGIGSHDGGYTIIEGSGLPRLTVVGFGRLVDWPVLVARLKAVTEGQMPVIQ